ncbi:hypothetical protein [Mycobacterium sp.]|uniref:hypothetical protein n=1 Tax=Mycobacterium sp. TaxID=1785 RepID=UPI0025F842E5|nr:hypothetical protein [Mycobacterium sp.]
MSRLRANYDLVATASTAGVFMIVNAPWPLWAAWGTVAALQIGNRVARMGAISIMRTVVSIAAAVWLASAGLAHADPPPTDPSPPPDAPRCMTMATDPWPHPQYLPCGWSWDGAHWTKLPI